MMKFICELIIMSISGTVMYGFSVLLRGRKYAAMRYAMLAAAAEESQTDDRPSYSFENTAADDTEEQESAPQPQTFVLPESAYIFNPDISKGDEVRSDNFYASQDIKLTVRYGAYENAAIAVYDADSGELVHDNGFRSYAPSFSMQMPEGSTYYIVVRGQEENFSIFISGE